MSGLGPGRRFDAVIFDFDGTILDTESTQFTTVQAEFQAHGHEYDLDEFLATVGRADGRHWAEVLGELVGPEVDMGAIRSRRLKAHHDLIAETDLRPGVVELIGRAEHHGKALGVASSSPLSWVERHLSERGLVERFRFLATRDLVERAKPDPALFLVAADGLGVDPATCLAIEDSHHGVAAAKAAGMACVAVPNPITRSSDFSEADLVLDSLADLPYAAFGLA